VKKKILEPSEIDGIYLFSKKYLNTQINKIFLIFEKFKSK
jgi:hypothetical protein